MKSNSRVYCRTCAWTGYRRNPPALGPDTRRNPCPRCGEECTDDARLRGSAPRGSLDRARRRIAELKLKVKKLEEHVVTDELTGLLNRRGIRRALDRELERARRTKTTISVSMIDVDDFKRVNDEEGHGVGDEVLRRLGREIKSVIRLTDAAGRIGGDELVVVLGDSSTASMHAAICRVTELVSSVRAGNGKRRIMASIGTVWSDGSETAEEVLKRADRAMYVAKGRGKEGRK
jgi:diguanylate cyclase